MPRKKVTTDEIKEPIIEIEEVDNSIKISDLILHIRRNVIWVASIALTIIILFSAYAIFTIKPTYTSTASLIIDPEIFSSNPGTNSGDYLGGLRATKTVEKWIVEDRVIKETLKELDLEGKVSVNSFKSLVRTQSSEEEIIIKVSLTTGNPETAYEYLDTLIAVSIELSDEIKPLKDSYQLLSSPDLGAKSEADKVTVVLVGIVLGVVLGVAFAIVKGVYASQFISTKDAERVLGIRTYGSLVCEENPTELNAKLPYSELNNNNYENLLNNINLSNVDSSYKVLGFTSTVEHEGKSTVVYNLSNTMARNNYKVLVIDLDMRKSKLHHNFAINRGKGITDYTTGQATLEEVVLNMDVNLDIVTAGSKTPNPLLILQSTKLAEFIADARKKYDYVLVDLPPVFMADTNLSSKYLDAFVFVVAAFSTKTFVAKDALNTLKHNRVKVLGTVLTKLRRNNNYYSNYYSAYGANAKETNNGN